MTLYRDILKKAWIVTWRNKFLWVFGFLASFLGLGSAYEVIYKTTNLSEQQDIFGISLWNEIAATGLTWIDIKDSLISSPLTGFFIFLFVAITLLVLLAFYWLFTCSQAALIKGVDAVETKKQDFHGLFEKSKKYFWKVFGMNILGKAIVFALLLLLSYPILLPLLSGTFSIASFLLFLLLFVIIFILVLAISIITVYAVIHLVLKDMSFGQSIAAAWKLFKNNWLVSLEAAVILFFISLLVALIFLIGSTIVYIPFGFAFQIAAYLQSAVLFWILVFFVGLLVLATFIFAAAILTTYQLAVWTTIFEQIDKGKIQSKLHRLMENHL